MKRCGWIALLPWAFGCTSDQIPEGEIVLVSGQETGVWTQEPRPSTLGITRIGLDGTETAFTTTAVPASDAEQPVFHMGRGDPAAFAGTATDPSGAPLVKGRTWILEPTSLEGYILGMFVGRVGVFSRPPGVFPVGPGDFPPVDVLGGRFLISMGVVENNQIRIDGYDFGLWDVTYTAYLPCLGDPCPVKSFGVVDLGIGVLVGDTWADVWDPGNASYRALPLPSGWQSWGDLAGGATVHNQSDGSIYIVGATRASGPTTAVLYVSAAGDMATRQLLVPRAGAAAGWVQGVGLVVVGGNSDPSNPGVEVLPDASANFVTRRFPADGTTGAGIVALADGSTVLRAGGLGPDLAPAPSVRLSLACQDACQLVPTGDTLGLASPTGFWLDGGDTFWIGTDPDGYTAARRLGASAGVTEVSLREQRIGASVVPNRPIKQSNLQGLPTGQFGLLGGHHPDGTPALTLEFYQP